MARAPRFPLRTWKLDLYELPPKRPQLNGAVERCNGAWRCEFYKTYDLPNTVEAPNPILDSFSTSTIITGPTEPLLAKPQNA